MKENMSKGPLFRSFFSSDVINMLRIKLILGEIKPGEKLVELKIAGELNVSRGPVRNALFLLEKEGLVAFLPNGRTEAIGFSLSDLDHLYETRSFLETKAVEEIFSAGSPNLNNIHSLNASMQKELSHVLQFTNLDLQYHLELVSLSGNKYLVQAWQSLRTTLETILLITNTQIRRKNNYRLDKGYVLAHHNQITEALSQGDRDRTIALVKEHLATGKLIMQERLGSILSGKEPLTAQGILETYGLGS